MRAIWVLWPSFIVGGMGVGVFFTLVDPQELYLFGEPVHWSPLATYSLGFFCFWALAAISSALTCFFQRNSEEINRCPLPPAGRPEGCPKREEPEA